MTYTAALAPLLALLLPLGAIAAQGVATAGIRGSVIGADGRTPEGDVQVRNDASGFTVAVRVSKGGFLVEGLEPGGPYSVVARGVGYLPHRRSGIVLRLGELAKLVLTLETAAVRLDTIDVNADPGSTRATTLAAGGTGTTIGSPFLDRLPSLNRDLYDFVRLVPQVSTKISLSNPGLSAAGVGFRFNNFLINGVSDRTLGGGVSGAFAGAKSISLDAVQEYQVLLAPYDVRYGDFAGALVNAVTKAGTNTLQGSMFAFGRNDRISRADPSGNRGRYERAQYGFTLGGPLVRDRVHFFVAPELQHFAFPAAGPYRGQPPESERAVPVAAAELDRFDTLMKGFGLSAGSAGAITNGNPLQNFFGRLDVAAPKLNSRVVFSSNYAGSEDAVLSRAARDTFSLSSYGVTRVTSTRVDAMHVHTYLARAGGGHNELLVSHRRELANRIGAVQQPIVRVAVSGGRITLNSGTHETAQGFSARPRSYTIKDNLTLSLGQRHVVTAGAEMEMFRIERADASGSYGTWTFASLRDFELGIADRYEVRAMFGTADTPISGTQYAAYVSDQWHATGRLTLTAGLRADRAGITERAPYHALVDSRFGRRTDLLPRNRVELSPRLGFVWKPDAGGESQLRGGAGVFVGRHPLAWTQTALTSHGIGGVLRCASVGGSQFPPPFNPVYTAAPLACSDGVPVTAERPGDVDLLDPDLRMMRVLRASLAHDWQLARHLRLTTEGMLTRALSDFVLVNLNLADPVSADRDGRIMYGVHRSNGAALPSRRSLFTEVIETRNTSRNRSYSLSARLETAASRAATASLSYTFSRVRDVQTPVRVNTSGTANWASARVTGGRHDDLTASISSNDVPHRVVAAGVFALPWRRARTELSFYYVGESGRPFTYTSAGTLGRGDLNADGSSANDPIYVPRSAHDTLEIRFSGLSDAIGADTSDIGRALRVGAQQSAFETFVERTSCLRRQRGRILGRNTCREPWSNTTIASVRQSIPIAGRVAEMQLDVFNALNLLNSEWGQRREAAPGLLEHVGHTADQSPAARPVFRFDATQTGLTTIATESAFQLQLGLRYRF